MKTWSRTVFVVYLVVLLWLVLFKFTPDLVAAFTHPHRTLNVVPFAGLNTKSALEMLFNFAVFIPFGLFLNVVTRLGFWWKLAGIFLFSVGVETIQYVFAIGASDITDVISNTLGGLAGLGLYALGARYLDKRRLDRWVTIVGAILLAACIVFVAVMLLHGVRYQVNH